MITEATPGYDVPAVIGNATPAIDPSKLPDPNGATYSRKALTGDIGVVVESRRRRQPVRALRPQLPPSESRGDVVRRHRPRAAASLPNVTVEPETGNNFDVGVKFRSGIVQRRRLLLLQPVPELHRAGPGGREQRRPARSRRRATSATSASPASSCRARCRSRCVPGVLTLTGSAALTRGTIIEGTDPLDNSLAGRYAVRQHHAVEADRQRALHAVARAVVGGIRRARAGRSDARGGRRCSTRRS